MGLKYKLLLFKLFLIKFFVLFKNTLVIFIVFFFYFYFATNSLKDLDFNSIMVFGIIFIGLLVSFIIDLKKQLNKSLLVKYYSKKVNSLYDELEKIVKIFELNKNFVNEKISLNFFKKVSDKDMDFIIKFLQKNEDILLNTKLLKRYSNLKIDIDIIIYDIEKLFLSFSSLELKQQIFDEYKKIKEVKKKIYLNIKSFEKDINKYLLDLEKIIQELINKNQKNIKKITDTKLQAVLMHNNIVLEQTLNKVKRSIKT